jgi:hypothetical protein
MNDEVSYMNANINLTLRFDLGLDLSNQDRIVPACPPVEPYRSEQIGHS